MKPVMQTMFYDPDPDSPRGNCVQACFASLLHLSLDEVPHFYEVSIERLEGNERSLVRLAQKDSIDNWLFARGLAREVYFPSTEERRCRVGARFHINEMLVLSGTSPRGVSHATLGTLNEEGVWKVLHDPHPSGAGILQLDMVESIYPAFKID